MTRHLLTTAALALVFAASGCFGSGSDADDDVREAVERAFEASVDGYPDTYCALLTGRALGYPSGPDTQQECLRRGRRAPIVGKGERADVESMTVEVKRLEGDSARVAVRLGGSDEDPFPLDLEKVDGEWLISDFDPRGYREKLERIFDKVDRSRNTAADLDCSTFSFNGQRWRRRDDFEGEPPTPRQRLADAAIKCRSFVGLSEAELVGLLGRPDERFRRTLSWYTGEERRFISLDSELLTASFDVDGRVRRVEVYP